MDEQDSTFMDQRADNDLVHSRIEALTPDTHTHSNVRPMPPGRASQGSVDPEGPGVPPATRPVALDDQLSGLALGPQRQALAARLQDDDELARGKPGSLAIGE